MGMPLKLRSPSRIVERRSPRRSWLGSLLVKWKATSSCIQNRKNKNLFIPHTRHLRAEISSVNFQSQFPGGTSHILAGSGCSASKLVPHALLLALAAVGLWPSTFFLY